MPFSKIVLFSGLHGRPGEYVQLIHCVEEFELSAHTHVPPIRYVN